MNIEDLINALTLDEKLLLLGGNRTSGQARDGDAYGVARVGLPPLKFADGPIGVHWWTKSSTCYPALICLASTMDSELARAYGAALGDDCRAVGVHVLLAPGMNLYRSSLCGRNFEYLGEDPELAGQLAAAYVRGLQSRNVAATVKHFAANNQEYDRHGISSDLDERTLREVYLRAFERAIQEGGAAGVMTAYGLLNGQHCSENAWLTDELLRNEWGFDGWVMSDWTSVHSTVQTFNSGLDLEMPWARYLNPEAVRAALANGRISESKLDAKIRHRLKVMARFGWLDPKYQQLDPAIPSRNPASEAVALAVARRGIVLLKNENNCLPARPETIRRIAVLGHHAQTAVLCGGGSAYTSPYSSLTLAEALAQTYGPEVQLDLHACVDPWRGDTVFKTSAFTTASGEPGLEVRYFENDRFYGTPVQRRDERIDGYLGEGRPAGLGGNDLYSAIWNGFITVAADGDLDFYMETEDGYLDASVDGLAIFSSQRGPYRRTLPYKAGRYPVEIRFRQSQRGYVKFRFGYEPAANARLDYAAGLEAARHADLVVVTAGFVSQTEGESHDRDFEMDARLVGLIVDAAAVSKRVVVALYVGGAVQTAPWLDKVQAALCLWYPGQNGVLAAAEIVAGLTNPSGKLPFTWEKKVADRSSCNCYHDTDGDKRVSYDDGIFTGYRHFDRHGIEPRFPFGHGLSFTTFAYDKLQFGEERLTVNSGLTLSFEIRNIGKVAGAESALIFVGDDEASVVRPVRELKVTCSVFLDPGESKLVTVKLDQRAFAFWHPDRRSWVTEPGGFTISVGPSAQHLPLQASITLGT